MLAQKIVALFGLSKQLLSNLQHYDWGLRSLKTILLSAGAQVQIFSKSDEWKIMCKYLKVAIIFQVWDYSM